MVEDKLRLHPLNSCNTGSQTVLLTVPKNDHPLIQFDFASLYLVFSSLEQLKPVSVTELRQ